ncbi:MAG: ABC transporter permease subunit [Lachnospiraceae bacterium]|jgi:NitT/TauT family transport system permease protein|nr:ABC transporter permease subunit [Lachnospiraceae bacterium]
MSKPPFGKPFLRKTTHPKATGRKPTLRLWAVLAWLLIWQGLSLYIGHEILLPSPLAVIVRLIELAKEPVFWSAVWFSLLRIASGFALAVTVGVLLAAFAARWRRIEEFLTPVMLLIKATPVASFIILVLIWVNSANLSVIISFLMVLPIMYTNVRDGIANTDIKLIEMAQVFSLPKLRRVSHIYLPQTLPYFQSACMVGLGLCWKSGIAAEVIGIPTGSIGERLYLAKIYLAIPDLFAWTLTIVLVSIVFERLFMLFLRTIVIKLERGGERGSKPIEE